MRQALRIYGREPGFSFFAFITLALGMAAATAVFSIVKAVLLQPLGYPQAERLYAVREFLPQLSHLFETLPVNARHFERWQQTCAGCGQIALVQSEAMTLTESGDPVELSLVAATVDLFPMLGISPSKGRGFRSSEMEIGRNQVVVISDALWRQRYAADPNIVGRAMKLDGKGYEIIGVLAPELRFPKGEQLGERIGLPSRVDGFIPLAIRYGNIRPMGNFDFACLLKIGQSAAPERVEAEMTAALADFAEQFGLEMKVLLRPLKEQMTAPVRGSLELLLAAVGALLLLVCINLGSLMLARTTRRSHAAAVRQALGASRGRIFGLVLKESLALALPGGLAGALLAYGGLEALLSQAPIDMPRAAEVQVDAGVLVFAFLTSLASALILGLWPALRMTRSNPQQALFENSSWATDSGGRVKSGSVLVAAEVALSALLLITGSFLLVSFFRLLQVDKGFDSERLLVADLTLPFERYPEAAQRNRFHERLLERLQALPEVTAAGLVNLLPLEGKGWEDALEKPGEEGSQDERRIAQFRFVSPAYWEAMGIRLIEGRLFGEADRDRRVAVIARRTAQAVWPGEAVVGKSFRRPGEQAFSEVIGVVEDVRTMSLEEEPGLVAYQPYWILPPQTASYVLRTAADPLAAAGSVRRAVWELDRELAVSGLRSMDQVLTESVALRRFVAMLAIVFALSALALACLGIYGVASCSAARRRQEIGIRMALGADRSKVVAMVLRQGLTPVAAGLAVGLLGGLAAGRLLGSFLFQISPRDPAVLGAVVLVLAAAAALACCIPAWRASRLNPLSALRRE